jgi:hypothetical protein
VRLSFLTISKLRSALAFVLVLWCAGTGCLAHGMAMGGSAERAVSDSSLKDDPSRRNASMGGHACCKARHRALQNASTPGSDSDSTRLTSTLPEESSPSNANSCCPLTSGSFVTVSRGQTCENDGSELILTAAQKSIRVTLLTERATKLRLTGREHTYLDCCALLI